jgi:hypothetical protein
VGRSVIKQPDGRYAVFSTGTDRWLAWDLTREQYAERCVKLAVTEALADATRLLDDVDNGTYCAGYTFEEANAESAANGGEDLSGKLTPEGAGDGDTPRP